MVERWKMDFVRKFEQFVDEFSRCVDALEDIAEEMERYNDATEEPTMSVAEDLPDEAGDTHD